MCAYEWQPQSSLCQFMATVSMEQAGGNEINELQRGIYSGQDLNTDFLSLISNYILDRLLQKPYIFNFFGKLIE